MKEKYAKENNDAMKLASKILLNSGYGSLCRKDSYDSYLYFRKNAFKKELQKQETVILGDGEWIVKNNHQHFNFNPEQLDLYVMRKLKEPEYSVNIAAAAYITSLQRAYLMNTVNKVGKKNFVMCDTDSILFTNLNKKQKKIINMCLLGDGLGRWTDECKKYELKYFGSYGAKRYILKSKNKLLKLRFAGVSMNVSKLKERVDCLDFGEGHITIENAVYRKIYTKSGVGLEKTNKTIARGMY